MLRSTLLKAMEAGASVLRHYFHRTYEISHKDGVNNLVTQADKESESAIITSILQDFPDHAILSEESGSIPRDSAYLWIIDPIDGTVNFANRIPICCVSIGLEKDGEMVLGGVYNPFMDEYFLAERGKGATLNDQAIHVSEREQVGTSCLVTGFPYTYPDAPNGPLEVFERFIRKGIPIRRLGSAALDLCWVAAGRFDGFFEHQLNAWDSAAGFLIVEEAGGRVTDFNGKRYSPHKPQVVATNGRIHDELLTWITPGFVP